MAASAPVWFGFLTSVVSTVGAPVLTDKIKQLVRQKSSTEQARDRVLSLYDALGRVRRTTDEYIDALYELARAITTSSWFDMSRVKQRVRESMGRLREDVIGLDTSLAALDSQLDIYRHDVVQGLHEYLVTRDDLLSRLERDIDTEISTQYLNNILISQVSLNSNLNNVIEELREFIASQFKFTQTFPGTST